jgi:hypothetical protein
LAHLPARAVFLLIKRVVFTPGDMAPVLACRVALLLANLMVIAMESRRPRATFHLPHFVVNAPVLIREALIDPSAAWARRIPVGLRRGGAGE